MIEASFTTQYGIRLRNEPDMTWSEFSTLLKGIMPETPLGQVVSIRSEEDKEMLKNFTPEQHKIRNDWRNRNNSIRDMSNEEKEEEIKKVQEIFAKAFG
ncbi:Gp15 family bacteriophage protein [Clostridium tertium]|uniref:Gp15 family bacteriophage protein n=1 Tax=Clostridium TaxID=1485 RepID=UPI001FA89955|nr:MULTISPECIES: Gp15 family bacteriophage protein [Clostridium]MDB1956833.1 Gp15 family bacteriophage protein [Clostridium tertium]MDB1959160.1 Gp15 family bacteriophage protein [Clostridium tertium]MDB1963234.1 Gp15 family bacteriophage protein [Clostridium tertium]MDB1967856.1 Gp15 family bacteriophage protein [Clostridium tertium]MDU2155341.1 Gp15 family bacteriophage protein [Clostridium sp.]